MVANRNGIALVKVTLVSIVISACFGCKNEVCAWQSELKGLEQFRSAVVTIKAVEEPKRYIEDGLIISPQGHVIIHECYRPEDRRIRAGDRLQFQLADGREVMGKALGWSDEWEISLAQLLGEGRWNYIPLCPSEEVKAGIPCISFGKMQIAAASFENEKRPVPLMSFGVVRRVVPGQWLTSDSAMNDHNPVFDYRGRLLGITTVITAGELEKVQTHVGVIQQHWDYLVAGKNIDKVRADSVTKERAKSPVYSKHSKEPDNKKADAAEIAKRATVRIRPTNRRESWDDRGWSGIVVTDQGHVVTCGHHDRMPGEKVTIHFSDGKVVKGKILGTNRVTDIGVAKITDAGKWPYAKLGLSQNTPANAACVFAGYPATYEGIEPIVRKGKVAVPDGYVWSRFLLTSGFEFKGGDSGGGLFNEDGELIGTLMGNAGSNMIRHIRSEFFHLQWKDLVSGRPVDRVDEKSE